MLTKLLMAPILLCSLFFLSQAASNTASYANASAAREDYAVPTDTVLLKGESDDWNCVFRVVRGTSVSQVLELTRHFGGMDDGSFSYTLCLDGEQITGVCSLEGGMYVIEIDREPEDYASATVRIEWDNRSETIPMTGRITDDCITGREAAALFDEQYTNDRYSITSVRFYDDGLSKHWYISFRCKDGTGSTGGVAIDARTGEPGDPMFTCAG